MTIHFVTFSHMQFSIITSYKLFVIRDAFAEALRILTNNLYLSSVTTSVSIDFLEK